VAQLQAFKAFSRRSDAFPRTDVWTAAEKEAKRYNKIKAARLEGQRGHRFRKGRCAPNRAQELFHGSCRLCRGRRPRPEKDEHASVSV
jgi:hypothetical protein